MSGRGCFPSLIIAVAAWVAAAPASNAAALRAEFNALAPRPRSNAPTPVEVKLHWHGAGLLEGVLELTLLGDDTPMLRQRSHELALTAGTQTLRLLLPPRFGRDYVPRTDVHLRFLGKKGATDVGRFPVSNSSYGAQSFLIGVCGAPHQPSDGVPQLWQTLRFDRHDADKAAGATIKPSGAPQFATSPMMMEAEDLPSSPLAFCAFDLVLLEGDSFARLREKQLAALARWIEAGGRLCVVAGSGLSDDHLRFLDQFSATPAAPSVFGLDQRGQLTIADGDLRMLRAELGRIVVTTKPPQTAAEASATAWTDASAFLWKFPEETQLAVSGTRHLSPIGAAQLGQPPARKNWQQRDSHEQRREKLRQYLRNLLPQSTRLIPKSVVAAILGAFVLIVGPGDWFVLGWLKRRRWTWLTFPVVAAVFTALTVAAAEHYLGAEDFRSALVITDVGRGGRVLRESRLELLFAARDKEATTELRQMLAAPTALATHRYSRNSLSTAPVLYDGQFPARAVLRQRLQQWTPQVNRLLSLESSPDASGIRWDEITTPELAAKPRPATWFATRAGREGFRYLVFHRGQLKEVAGGGDEDAPFLKALSFLPRDGTTSEADFDDSARLARKDPQGWLTAPSGDADLTDLALAAHDDPNVWLVVAIKRTPGEIRICRRLYLANDK